MAGLIEDTGCAYRLCITLYLSRAESEDFQSDMVDCRASDMHVGG